jgi:hypothetical protein
LSLVHWHPAQDPDCHLRITDALHSVAMGDIQSSVKRWSLKATWLQQIRRRNGLLGIVKLAREFL